MSDLPKVLMKNLPTINPQLQWARFEYPNEVGPWFGTTLKKVKFLVFGQPKVGDLVLGPYSERAEVYVGDSEDQDAP